MSSQITGIAGKGVRRGTGIFVSKLVGGKGVLVMVMVTVVVVVGIEVVVVVVVVVAAVVVGGKGGILCPLALWQRQPVAPVVLHHQPEGRSGSVAEADHLSWRLPVFLCSNIWLFLRSSLC